VNLDPSTYASHIAGTTGGCRHTPLTGYNEVWLTFWTRLALIVNPCRSTSLFNYGIGMGGPAQSVGTPIAQVFAQKSVNRKGEDFASMKP
jgi:hypothetical protein